MNDVSGPSGSPLAGFTRKLGYEFSDPAWLRLASTHRSYCAENSDVVSNERLEFLGDAVLGLAVTDHIYQTYEELSEGELAKLRASVVNTATLAVAGGRLGLGDILLLGKGEDQSGGRLKESILADSLEAVIGAVYLDRGWSAAQGVVLALLMDEIDEGSERPGRQDYKTRLQELAAQKDLGPPNYRVDGSGPDHERKFEAVVIVNEKLLGEGSGTSKKRAEQAAARSAWAVLANVSEE